MVRAGVEGRLMCLGCWFLKQRGLTSPSGFLLGLCSTSVRFLRPCPPSLHSIISFVFGAPVVYHSHTPGGWGCTCPPSHQIRGSSMCRLAPSLSFGDGQRLDGGFRLGGPAWCPGHAWCRASECQGSCGHRAAVLSPGSVPTRPALLLLIQLASVSLFSWWQLYIWRHLCVMCDARRRAECN